MWVLISPPAAGAGPPTSIMAFIPVDCSICSRAVSIVADRALMDLMLSGLLSLILTVDILEG